MEGLQFPSKKELIRFTRWLFGRFIFCLILFSILLVKNFLRFLVWILEKIEKDILEILNLYNAMIQSNSQKKITIKNDSEESFHQPSDKDILTLIEGKHCLIIGNTGSGKSTLTQWLASKSQRVKIYDPDAAPGEWGNLPVIGKGGNFTQVEEEMKKDLVELKTRIKIRSQEGDKGLLGCETCIIAEEFPALKDECETAPDWLGKIARRGRKPKMFLVVLSQSDNVKALGIEGDGPIRQNFAIVRLGKFGISHAKRLKNDELVQWLKEGKYRCLVEDEPCQLPDLSNFLPTSEIKLLPVEEVTEVINSQDVQDVEVIDNDLKTTINFLIESGKSHTFIIENVLGYKGRKFEEGKKKLSEILG